MRAEGKSQVCKYPKCYYHSPGAEYYCCDACSGDHYDYDRLNKEEEKKEVSHESNE